MFCYNIKARNGRLAQLGEHLPYKQRVTGSSPVLSTKKDIEGGVQKRASAESAKHFCPSVLSTKVFQTYIRMAW